MIINTFLLANPGLNIEGVIFGSPFFGMAEHLGLNPVKMALIRVLVPLMEPFGMQGSVHVHRISSNHRYAEKALTQIRSFTLINIEGVADMVDSCDCIQNYASQFKYPFLMLLGSEDRVISNNLALQWFGRTTVNA